MKKLFFCGVAAALALGMGFTSCDNASSSSEACEYLTAAQVDSLSQLAGQAAALNLLQEFNGLPDSIQEKFNKTDIIRGYQTMLSEGDNNSFSVGVNIAMRALGECAQREQTQNIKIDKKAMLQGFKTIFSKDSISEAQALAIRENMNRIQASVEKAREDFNNKIAQENVEAGKAYVTSLIKDGKKIEEAPSGLYYSVAVQGDTSVIAESSRVKLRYTGTLTDGKVFDSSDKAPDSIATFGLRSVVKGFAEGIKLLGVGGKGTLYIPGDLGYGKRGEPRAGIGPDQMIIFDVDVVEVLDQK